MTIVIYIYSIIKSLQKHIFKKPQRSSRNDPVVISSFPKIQKVLTIARAINFKNSRNGSQRACAQHKRLVVTRRDFVAVHLSRLQVANTFYLQFGARVRVPAPYANENRYFQSAIASISTIILHRRNEHSPIPLARVTLCVTRCYRRLNVIHHG